jgi:hypothetical protein
LGSRMCGVGPLYKIFRRKLMPNLEQVTWSDPTVTPSKLAISSRLTPCATNSLIFSIAWGVNFARLPLAEGLAFVIVMAPSTVVASHQWSLGIDFGFTRPQNDLMPCFGHIVPK